MRNVLLATALLAACVTASAQQPAADVPKAKCEPVPVMPARSLMADKMVKRTFDNDLKNYKDCMTGYLDQRKAVIAANTEAANAAINDFNAVMKALNDASGANAGGDAAPRTDSYKK